MKHYIVGIGLFVALALLWVLVQSAWRKAFADTFNEDHDVLSGRGNCTNCSCRGGDVCEDKENKN